MWASYYSCRFPKGSARPTSSPPMVVYYVYAAKLHHFRHIAFTLPILTRINMKKWFFRDEDGENRYILPVLPNT